MKNRAGVQIMNIKRLAVALDEVNAPYRPREKPRPCPVPTAARLFRWLVTSLGGRPMACSETKKQPVLIFGRGFEKKEVKGDLFLPAEGFS